ncbi:hypothetical protein N7541_004203 [Penicillium brevicompactum]|uniref:Uncharacterized protein n=1 Tax=Penicillium brevicompactum TaxID=5074 RepID=A0A9W9RQD8_PENBR|nr:hypothetical protein N7541_004203 [Penicillium brevicompactum]
MGATRRRRSSRQSSSQDSPSDCFGVCGAGSGRRRRDADQAQANRPVELQGLPGPTPYYTPGGRHQPTSRRQSTPHEVGGDQVPSKQQFRHTLGNLDHENQEAINTAPGTLALGPAYLLVINPPPDSLALGPADLLVINPLQHILDLGPPALALTVPLRHALGAALPYAPLPGSLSTLTLLGLLLATLLVTTH